MLLKCALVMIAVVSLNIPVLSADNNTKQRSSDISIPEVRIGRVICGGHLPLAVVEKTYQKSLSTFRLKAIQYHDWKIVINDMLAGKIAGTFILSPLALELIRQGLPAKIVLAADRNGNGFVLSKKIKSVLELKNRTTIIAVPHIYSQQHVLLHLILKQNDIPLDKVAVVSMPPRDMINSLRRSEIDGFVVGEPEGNKSISLNVGWLAAISPQIWSDHMDHVFIVRNQFINENPEQLQELITALVRGCQFIESNPHAAAIMGEDYTGSKADVFEQVLTSPPNWIDYNNMVPTVNDIKSMSIMLVRMGLWKDMPVDHSLFTDIRFVNKAVQNISNVE